MKLAALENRNIMGLISLFTGLMLGFESLGFLAFINPICGDASIVRIMS